MRSIKITFSDGDTRQTQINGTDDEIRRYYVGTRFNHGAGDGPDRMVTALSVEFTDSTRHEKEQA